MCVCAFFSSPSSSFGIHCKWWRSIHIRRCRCHLVDFYSSINVLTLLEWVLLVDSLPMFIHGEQLTASLAISAPSLLHPSIHSNHQSLTIQHIFRYAVFVNANQIHICFSVCVCVCVHGGWRTFNFNHSKATNNCLLCIKRMLDI